MFIDFLRKKKMLDYSSRELVIDILKKLNCTIKEDEDSMYFTYQGKDFVIKPLSRDTLLIYSQEGKIDLDDKNILILQRVLNHINYQYEYLSSFGVEDKESNSWWVINKVTTVFIPEIPEIQVYLQKILNMFFDAGRDIRGMFQAEISRQEQTNEPFRVKGFNQVDKD